MTLQTSPPPVADRGAGFVENLRAIAVWVATAALWPITKLRTKAQQRERDREIRALYRQVFGKPTGAALSPAEAKNMVRWRQSRLVSTQALVR